MREMNKKKEKQELIDFYRLLVAERDIRIGLEVCENIQKHCSSTEDSLYHQLFFSLVIAYSRPFTVSDRIGKLTKKWSKFTDPELQIVHSELLKFRNKMIAHNDPEIVKVYLIPKGVVFNFDGESIVNDEMAHVVKYKIPDIENVEKYYELCKFQIERILEYIHDKKDCLPRISKIEGVPFEMNMETINRIVEQKL